MKLAAAVFCCNQDEDILAVFVSRWRALYPDVDLWLVDDVRRSVKNTHSLPRVAGVWGAGGGGAHNVLASLQNVAAGSGSEYVVKVDCDVAHLCRQWLDDLVAGVHGDPPLYGFQFPGRQQVVCGGAYAIRADVLQVLARRCARSKGEDLAISLMVQESDVGDAVVMPSGAGGGFSGYHPDKEVDVYAGAQVVHCGQFIYRSEVADVMAGLLAALT